MTQSPEDQPAKNSPLARRRLLKLAALAMALAVIGLVAPDAKAQSLNQFRASGHIGERFDGYCVARSNHASVLKVVKSVNAKRQKIYAKRAREQGVKIGQVGRVYAKQIIQKAPAGTFILQANGKWVRK